MDRSDFGVLVGHYKRGRLSRRELIFWLAALAVAPRVSAQSASSFEGAEMNWDVKYFPGYWAGRRLAYPDVPKKHPKFAQSIVVGNLIFVSGCTGQDVITGSPAPESVEDQVRVALENARLAMETAGSSMENIVKTFFLVRSLDDYPQIRKTETEYYLEHAPYLVKTPPAATLMVVPSLARPEFQVEYEIIGVVDRNAPEWGVKYYPEYWGGRELAYPHVPIEHAKFARTQVVGDLVILSGCQALDHDSVRVETMDFCEQTRIVLEKLRTGMEETGGSMSSLLKTTVFLKDPNHVQQYREVERAYFQQHAPDLANNPPASTVVIVSELPRPEFLIEVEAFGVVDKQAPNWVRKHYPGNEAVASGVSAGNLLFLSGCDGSNPETNEVETDSVEQQIILALDKVKAGLEGGGSSMDKVVKTLMMLRYLEDYPKMRKTELEYYEKHAPRLVSDPPVSTFVQLPHITSPKALFQIDVTAVL